MWQQLMELLPDLPGSMNLAWNGLMRLLPDVKTGTFEIRDLASLVVAALGAYLAFEAIRMGHRQEQLTAEQTAIAKRQGDIAEVQHRIMQEQLSKAAKLRVRCDTAQTHGASETTIPIEVFNEGNKTARGFSWEVLFSDSYTGRVRLVDVNGNLFRSISGVIGEDNTCYDQYEGHADEALFPGSAVQIGDIRVNTTTVSRFGMLWRIRFEDGFEPSRGFYRMEFTIDDHKFFNPQNAGEEHQREY